MSDQEKFLPEKLEDSSSLVSIKEVEAKILVAQKIGRNVAQCAIEARDLCQRFRFADGSIYALPRGNKVVNGPSVQFAKGIAQVWGHIDHKIEILEKGEEFTRGQACAWDLFKNISAKKEFYVKHERKAHGNIKKVTDPTEISELVGAQASRALRNALLDIIPWHIIDEAQEICAKTVRAEAQKTPIEQRREKAKETGKAYGIDDDKLKRKLGKTYIELSDEELFDLGKGFNAIRDKFITVAQWLSGEIGEPGDDNASSITKDIQDKKKADAEKAKTSEPEKEPSKSNKPQSDVNDVNAYMNATKGIKI